MQNKQALEVKVLSNSRSSIILQEATMKNQQKVTFVTMQVKSAQWYCSFILFHTSLFGFFFAFFLFPEFKTIANREKLRECIL